MLETVEVNRRRLAAAPPTGLDPESARRDSAQDSRLCERGDLRRYVVRPAKVLGVDPTVVSPGAI